MKPSLRPALLVMAKWPAPGQVKTRLCPPLIPEEAAALYRAMLEDVAAQARALAAVEVLVGFHPPEREADFDALLGGGVSLLPQEGLDLASRMGACFARAFESGHGHVVMRNSDAPTLPKAILRRAFSELASGADLVVSPDESAGYGVLGLSRPAPGLFDGPLPSERSLEETLARARRANLSVRRLAPWYDVDRPADLLRLLGQWRAAGTGPAVTAFLAGEGRGQEWIRRLPQ